MDEEVEQFPRLCLHEREQLFVGVARELSFVHNMIGIEVEDEVSTEPALLRHIGRGIVVYRGRVIGVRGRVLAQVTLKIGFGVERGMPAHHELIRIVLIEEHEAPLTLPELPWWADLCRGRGIVRLEPACHEVFRLLVHLTEIGVPPVIRKATEYL